MDTLFDTNSNIAVTFATEDEAYDYAVENRTCLINVEGDEVFCKRWDH